MTTSVRVLVVEDDRAVARLHCRYISRRPLHEVVGVAETGPQALTLLSQRKPDVVLLDLGLPGVNGLDVLREIRQAHSPVEVIVVSAHASPATVRTCMHLGVVDYLVKPFWPQRLGEALDELAKRSQALGVGVPLDQRQVDRLRGHGSADPEPTRLGERLEAVKDALRCTGLAMTAAEVADATGMARVTARRYLEQLVERGVCIVDTDPDGPGRPQKFYRLWAMSPVGRPAQVSRPSSGSQETTEDG